MRITFHWADSLLISNFRNPTIDIFYLSGFCSLWANDSVFSPSIFIVSYPWTAWSQESIRVSCGRTSTGWAEGLTMRLSLRAWTLCSVRQGFCFMLFGAPFFLRGETWSLLSGRPELEVPKSPGPGKRTLPGLPNPAEKLVRGGLLYRVLFRAARRRAANVHRTPPAWPCLRVAGSGPVARIATATASLAEVATLLHATGLR